MLDSGNTKNCRSRQLNYCSGSLLGVSHTSITVVLLSVCTTGTCSTIDYTQNVKHTYNLPKNSCESGSEVTLRTCGALLLKNLPVHVAWFSLLSSTIL